MTVYSVDFSAVEQIADIHLVLRKTLNFPEWYGKNLDALWDLLTGYLEPSTIDFSGVGEAPAELKPYIQKVLAVFVDAGEMYGEIKVGQVR